MIKTTTKRNRRIEDAHTHTNHNKKATRDARPLRFFLLFALSPSSSFCFCFVLFFDVVVVVVVGLPRKAPGVDHLTSAAPPALGCSSFFFLFFLTCSFFFLLYRVS